MKIKSSLTSILLGIWLALTGLIALLNLRFPFMEVVMGLLALAAGALFLYSLWGKLTSNIGMLLLSLWLILHGALLLFSLSFPYSDTAAAILALAAGAFLLLRR
ncbi:MAG: hypothetical protein AB1894_27070 [Chloroflexota bacterium]